jgi:hypothetical protein
MLTEILCEPTRTMYQPGKGQEPYMYLGQKSSNHIVFHITYRENAVIALLPIGNCIKSYPED